MLLALVMEAPGLEKSNCLKIHFGNFAPVSRVNVVWNHEQMQSIWLWFFVGMFL